MPTLPALSQFTGSGVSQDQFKAAFAQLHAVMATLFSGYTGATAAFMNPASITDASFEIPAGYNAVSAGPITIAEGAVVEVGDGACWSIV